MPIRWTFLLVVLSALAGCGAAERAQQRDPMRCERNPNCASGKGIYADCSMQCSYDPECTKRCESTAIDGQH
jgi:hypothetical protein